MSAYPGKAAYVVIGVVIAAVLAWWLWPEAPFRRPAGAVVSAVPSQTSITGGTPLERAGCRIQPIAVIEMEALVLGAARYRFDAESRLSPVDLALGWGVMSDSAVLNRLSISQDGRWYQYSWSGPAPGPVRQMGMSSSNVHVIPADDEVERAVLAVRKDDVVRLRGRLVSVSYPDGRQWKSSIYRSDSGGGACEIVWLEKLERLDK